jgi:sarcosine oxidase subunit beta
MLTYPAGVAGSAEERCMAEAIVVGAGVVGASVAFHLAEKGIGTLVVDREGPVAGSTARSGALIRAHYPTALEADLTWESLTGYFEPWDERVGGGCGFTRTGFAYLAGEDGVEALRHNVALQRGVGVESELIGSEELRKLDPALRPEGVALAAYEPRGGYADPTAATVGFLRAALARGARFERRRVASLRTRGDEVVGVQTESGPLAAPVVVLAAGAWSVPLAAGAGLELPIKPARAQVALFERPYSLPTHLTLIDSTLGFYARPTAERATLVGTRAHLSWLEDPDAWDPEPDLAFVEAAADMLNRRIPVLGGAPYRSGRAGVLDITPDGRPILGPEGPEGLCLAVGWSGTGFKKAPAVGAEIARWISDGAPRREELRAYTLDRFRTGELIFGEHEPGAKTLH